MASDVAALKSDVAGVSVDVNWARTKVSMLIDDVATQTTSSSGQMRMNSDEMRAFRRGMEYRFKELKEQLGKY